MLYPVNALRKISMKISSSLRAIFTNSWNSRQMQRMLRWKCTQWEEMCGRVMSQASVRVCTAESLWKEIKEGSLQTLLVS